MEAILQAAFQILEARGAAGLTTNRVAERAGVSIGTLYQYFADKEAILAAMGQRQAVALRERITSILLASPQRGSVRAIVQAVLHGIEGSPGTRMALSEALFRTRGEAALSEQHLALLGSLSGRSELDFVLGKESAFILTHAVICLVRAAAAEPELKLDSGALEEELVLLMESYIRALAARAQRSQKHPVAAADGGTADEPALEEQKRYYRDRAPEYDDWWYRRGRYDRGEEHNARWYAEAEQVRQALLGRAQGGHVLEIAAGTGTWTRHLVTLFDRVTAVDAASETLAINRAQVAAPNVRYVQQDIYRYEPDMRFDFIFFGFWISHVPADRFEEFWKRLDRWLKPGGGLFFLDGYYAANAQSRRDEYLLHEDETQTRDLADGRHYEIVKRYYNPPKLQDQLRAMGWAVTVRNTPSFFLYGHGTPAGPR